jgi:phosphoribosylamine--glycine ligase
LPETIVYSAGVASRGGALVVGGGRVVTVVARGDDLEEAVARAYERASSFRFEGQQMRSDLGRQRFDHSHE